MGDRVKLDENPHEELAKLGLVVRCGSHPGQVLISLRDGSVISRAPSPVCDASAVSLGLVCADATHR